MMKLSFNTFVRGVFMLFALILCGNDSWSQKIVLYNLQKDSILWSKPLSRLKALNTIDTFALFAPLSALIDSMHTHGYFAAGLDSIRVKEDSAHIYIYQGNPFRIRRMYVHESKGILEKDTLVTFPGDSLFPFRAVNRFKQDILTKALEKGYPFASLHIKPLSIVGDSLNAEAWIRPDKLYTFGGLHVVGDLKISTYYLQQMIGLEIGRPYYPEITDKVSKKIRELTFTEQYKSPAIVFAEQKAWLALFLKKKNINRFDLLIGFQPNPNAIPGISKKLLLTGNATVELVNQFGKGEKLLAEYFQPSTLHQQLRLEGEYPFLLSTPIGVKSSFKLFRSDSTFTEKLFEVGGQYYFNYDSKLEIFWNRGTSDIGFVDTLNIIKTKKLPVNLDYRTDYFGLTFSMQRLDFKLNPRKGYSMSLSVGVGRRNIYPNNEITSIRGQDPKPFDYRSLYDTVTLHSTLFRPLVDVRLYIPLFKRMSFMIRTNGGMISGPKQVYNNEKFRIGGNKSLRGWNEQSVYTTSFLVATTELKMNLDELSSLFLFTDNGWINASNVAIEQFAWQLGVGAGINFATKVGVFGVSVALGKNRNIPFDFQTAKIHFGYQSVF